jgi:hypothetical protein
MDQLFVLGTYVPEQGRIFYYVASNRDGVMTTDNKEEAAHFRSEESANKAIETLKQYDTTFNVDTHGFWSIQ